VRLEPVDLSVLAQSSATDVISDYPTAQISIEPGIEANADPALLGLVFTNLFDNACKYSKPGQPPKIAFELRIMDGERVFCVTDEGIGIDMRYAHTLFQPFQRLHTQAEIPGTGIGLANVRRIVERHGGRIWLESQEGVGTSVLFTLSKGQ
jgi:signal transduction histidine kinase